MLCDSFCDLLLPEAVLQLRTVVSAVLTLLSSVVVLHGDENHVLQTRWEPMTLLGKSFLEYDNDTLRLV